MVKVSWNSSGEKELGEDGGVVGLFVVSAVVLLTEELVFKGVSVGGMGTSSWFELVESMCGVRVGS